MRRQGLKLNSCKRWKHMCYRACIYDRHELFVLTSSKQLIYICFKKYIIIIILILIFPSKVNTINYWKLDTIETSKVNARKKTHLTQNHFIKSMRIYDALLYSFYFILFYLFGEYASQVHPLKLYIPSSQFKI